MKRTYSLLIEGDESGYSAHVPELPAILVTAKSIDELNRRAAELARQAADEFSKPGSPRFVAGSMGPTTRAISVTAPTDHTRISRTSLLVFT